MPWHGALINYTKNLDDTISLATYHILHEVLYTYKITQPTQADFLAVYNFDRS
jgi:hypothetical protein